MALTIGVPHRHFRRTDSTNTRARELAAAGAPGGTVVTADEQTAGRGRQGRTWTAPPGKALLYSAILRPFEERHSLAPLAAALAVCETAEALRPDIECRIKWPNDVWIEGRKLAGILVETRAQEQWAVVGVGLNLSIAPHEFPPGLRDTATSLFGSRERGWGDPLRSNSGEAPSGIPPTPLTAAAALSRHLDRWVEAEPQTVLAAWRQRDALRGREVAWEGGSGVADGVDDRGCLVVVSPAAGRTVLSAGDVHLRL
jgi:BirA family transcriptional regulator, biotin operon repressor / biotin---[acetyl-CoA-carboxylase] ligase